MHRGTNISLEGFKGDFKRGLRGPPFVEDKTSILVRSLAGIFARFPRRSGTIFRAVENFCAATVVVDWRVFSAPETTLKKISLVSTLLRYSDEDKTSINPKLL